MNYELVNLVILNILMRFKAHQIMDIG